MVKSADAAATESVIDRLVASNHERGWSSRTPPDRRPRLQLAIVTCMDSRIDVFEAFGLEHGDAHIIRNAGGLVTDDTMRSLLLSQRLLGTREVMLVHHTECGVHGLDEAGFAAELESTTGHRPEYSMGAFADLDGAVLSAIERVTRDPLLVATDRVRGFVYDVETGLVREVGGAT